MLDPLPPPTVTATTPPDGAVDVAVDTSPTATFSRAMDPGSLGDLSVSLRTLAGASVAAAVSYEAQDTRVTIDPTEALASSTTYVARVSTAATASDGAAIGTPAEWTFTTETLAPTVTTITPADGATGVAVDVSPTATFSRPMDPATVTFATVTLTRIGGPEVTAVVTYTGSRRRVTINPTSDLDPGATYVARIDGVAMTTDGISLGPAFSWAFTTAAPAPPGLPATSAATPSPTAPQPPAQPLAQAAPRLVVLAPGGGGEIARLGRVIARFSEPVRLSAGSIRLVRRDGTIVPSRISRPGSGVTVIVTPTQPLPLSGAWVAIKGGQATGAVRDVDGAPLPASLRERLRVVRSGALALRDVRRGARTLDLVLEVPATGGRLTARQGSGSSRSAFPVTVLRRSATLWTVRPASSPDAFVLRVAQNRPGQTPLRTALLVG